MEAQKSSGTEPGLGCRVSNPNIHVLNGLPPFPRTGVSWPFAKGRQPDGSTAADLKTRLVRQARLQAGCSALKAWQPFSWGGEWGVVVSPKFGQQEAVLFSVTCSRVSAPGIYGWVCCGWKPGALLGSIQFPHLIQVLPPSV